MGSFDPFKIGLYVLLLLPGFIFVQVVEFHLLREEKPQFEKTLEIILKSAFIWIIALVVPFWWPWPHSRLTVMRQAVAFLGGSTAWAPVDLEADAFFFCGVIVWTFVFANVWGIARKSRRVYKVQRFVVGRDWYPAVALRFFEANINRAVVVTLKERRLIGVLASAPDRKEDAHIILTSVGLMPPEGAAGDIEPLPLVESMLVRIDDVVHIQALKQNILDRDRVSELRR